MWESGTSVSATISPAINPGMIGTQPRATIATVTAAPPMRSPRSNRIRLVCIAPFSYSRP